MPDVSSLLIQYLPSIVLLLVGFVLVVIEMYVPGFGVPGIAGILMLIGGVYFAHPSPLGAVIMVLVIVALLCIALSICLHSAANGRLAKSRFVLHDVATRAEKTEKPENSDMNYFVGRVGETKTVLRPAGMAEFDGVKLNVVSDGEYIASGAKVTVVRVEGNRIVVRENNNDK